MMKRTFIVTAFSLLLCVELFAQVGKYSVIDRPVDGLYAVSKGDDFKMGAIDITGREVIPVKYDYLSVINDSTFVVGIDGKTGVIDAKGNVVIPMKYEIFYHGQNGNFIADYKQVFDRTGAVRYTAAPGESIMTCDGTYVVVKKGDLFGLKTVDGKQIIPMSYLQVQLPAEGRIPVVKDDKMGYADLNGDIVIPLKFTYYNEDFEDDYSDPITNEFSEGLAAVMSGDKLGYIDINGNTVIPFKYSWASPFENGKAVVGTGEEDGWQSFKVDKTGRKLAEPVEYSEQDLKEGLAVFADKNTWRVGYKDTKTGKIVIPAKYIAASPFMNGYALVRIGDSICLIDKTGKVVLRNIASFSYFDAA